MSQKILIVDDDKKTVELVKLYLENEGFQVLTAYDGDEAIEVSLQKRPDLIVLDLMLPKTDGIDVCRKLRSQSDVPIIMLTARTTEKDKLLGLNTGADDYITKPFSPREVTARVRTVLRRVANHIDENKSQLVFGDLIIDFLRYEVRICGNPVHLTPKEFKLLEIMARQPGRAFSRSDLLVQAFGPDYEGLERTIDVHILNLRKKIDQYSLSTYIKTVYGLGYKFSEEGNVS